MGNPRKTLSLLLFLFTFLILSYHVQASHLAIKESIPVIKTINADDGLIDSEIIGITKDKNGEL